MNRQQCQCQAPHFIGQAPGDLGLGLFLRQCGCGAALGCRASASPPSSASPALHSQPIQFCAQAVWLVAW